MKYMLYVQIEYDVYTECGSEQNIWCIKVYLLHPWYWSEIRSTLLDDYGFRRLRRIVRIITPGSQLPWDSQLRKHIPYLYKAL